MAQTPDPQERSRYVVDAVDSALQVLELVSHHPGSSLLELSKRGGLNKSRTMRFLVTLEERGFVARDDLGRYYLSTRALILGDRARAQMGQLSAVQPILDRLRDATKETVQYRVLDGLQTVCLAKSDSPLGIRVHTETGRPRELYLGSSKSILAFADDRLLAEVLARPRLAFTQQTLVSDEALSRQLAEIRAAGYSVSRSERIEGALAIGAPIFNRDGSVTSCLSLLGPAFRIEARVPELAATLIGAAKEVEALSLGGRRSTAP